MKAAPHMLLVTCQFICAALIAASPAPAQQGLSPGRLRCEYLDRPLGLDEPRPRLSWVVASDRRGDSQTAYHLLAASSRALLDDNQGDLWDSGKVSTDQTAHVQYAGRPLTSGQRAWWIRQGATTLWEGWGRGGSHNHIFYGDVVNWFYSALAGINPDPSVPGFKHIIIRPHVVGDLTWAKASYDSVHGRIVSDWSKDNGTFCLNVVIPANTTATVYLPTSDAGSIREGGHALGEVEGAVLSSAKDGTAIVAVGSGHYNFTTSIE